jgi:hypothetical protein
MPRRGHRRATEAEALHLPRDGDWVLHLLHDGSRVLHRMSIPDRSVCGCDTHLHPMQKDLMKRPARLAHFVIYRRIARLD